MNTSTGLVETEEKRHNLEVKKNSIKQFADTLPQDIEIDHVDIYGGFLGLGDHKVTGIELNNRMTAIQTNLVKFNNEMVRVIKEFREIYELIDSLDKDYVCDIVANMNALYKTSNDVREHQKILVEHQNKIKEHQIDLDAKQAMLEKAVDDNAKVLKIIKAFNKKLQQLNHLTDIDSIWNDCKRLHHDISENAQQLEMWKKYYEKICNDMVTSEELHAYINTLNSYISQSNKKLLETTEEIIKQSEEKEIRLQGSINETREALTEDLKNNGVRMDAEMEQINQQFLETTGELEKQIHQQDNKLQNEIENTKYQLLSDIDQKKDSIKQEIQLHVEKTDALEHTMEDEITGLKDKIKILYYALGGTVSLLVIQTILNVMGVI